MIGLFSLGGALLICSFIAVFLLTNNINVSFDALFNDASSTKYPAEAFANKRKGLLTATISGNLSSPNIEYGHNLVTDVVYSISSQKVKLSVRDKKNRPVSRITVIGTVSRVGGRKIVKQFKMKESSKGVFSSVPLDLADGGWIIMVSAYNMYTNKRDKLLFHTERSIFLKK